MCEHLIMTSVLLFMFLCLFVSFCFYIVPIVRVLYVLLAFCHISCIYRLPICICESVYKLWFGVRFCFNLEMS